MTLLKLSGERCARVLVIAGIAVVWGGIAWTAVTMILERDGLVRRQALVVSGYIRCNQADNSKSRDTNRTLRICTDTKAVFCSVFIG